MLLPLTRDPGWFFDTELLVLAQQAGLRIHEVPVDWTDDTDSRVHVIATILADLRGIARFGTGLLAGRIAVPFLGQAGPPAGHRPGLDAARPAGLRRQLAGFAAVGVSGSSLARHYRQRRAAEPA